MRGRSGGLRLMVALMTLATLQPAAEAFMLQTQPPASPWRSTGARTLHSARRPELRMGSALCMSGSGEGAGEGRAGETERGGGGVAVLTRDPDVQEAGVMEEKKAVFAGNWRVLLHRDEWDTFDWGQEAIMFVCPMIGHKKAKAIAMQAHMTGLAHVITAPKPMARAFSLGFTDLGLTSSIAPDRSNED
mmetsp:Transcript_19459/g.43855  ORF Transcript_19459/g.43855 Transcript_19459/m.43855 type:complete len:189 (+) Transcript_19459:3-569(+)